MLVETSRRWLPRAAACLAPLAALLSSGCRSTKPWALIHQTLCVDPPKHAVETPKPGVGPPKSKVKKMVCGTPKEGFAITTYLVLELQVKLKNRMLVMHIVIF